MVKCLVDNNFPFGQSLRSPIKRNLHKKLIAKLKHSSLPFYIKSVLIGIACLSCMDLCSHSRETCFCGMFLIKPFNKYASCFIGSKTMHSASPHET